MHDISIIIPTVCRDSLIRAVQSIFDQDFDGSIQILIGVDKDVTGKEKELEQLLRDRCPDNQSIFWLNPGYSTSKRHGGVHDCFYGGSLRTSLSFLADSKFVMYLDDDDWLAPNHCQLILDVIQDKTWAFSYCIYANGNTSEGLCTDLLESVGPNKGIFKDEFGGFVRPSGLTIDKTKVPNILHLWSSTIHLNNGDGEDRLMFEQLKKYPYGETSIGTVYCSLDPADHMHEKRLEYIRQHGKDFLSEQKSQSLRSKKKKSFLSKTWKKFKNRFFKRSKSN